MLKIKSPQADGPPAYEKVMRLFFAFPTKPFGLSDVAKAVGISKTNANKAVTRLVKEGFLKREVLGNVWRLTCDQAHEYNTTPKIPYHLNLIYGSGILEAIHKLIPSPRAIILFGSYRKGDDTEKSDIDIAVEVVDDKDIRMAELGVLGHLGYRKDIRVNLHIFSRNKVNLNIFANIANGIVLEGFLEVRP